MARSEGYRWFKGPWHPSEAQRRVLDELAAGADSPWVTVREGGPGDGGLRVDRPRGGW